MAPFLLAAIASAMALLLFVTVIGPWLQKKGGSEPKPGHEIASISNVSESSAEKSKENRVLSLFALWPAVLVMGVFVFSAEFAYMVFVHSDLDRHYFFDGPMFRQVVFGSAFGILGCYLIFRTFFTKLTEASWPRSEQQGAAAPDGVQNMRSNTEYIIPLVVLLTILLVGAFQQDVFTEFAKLGGNVRLGAVEFGFGRNEGRASETSVAQLVPPANVPGVHAPPSVSQGLQSLAELSETMRRDALIYALRKGLFGPDEERGDGPTLQKSERSPDFKLIHLAQQAELSDRVFVYPATCLLKDNEKFQDYITSGEQILPLAKKLNTKLRARGVTRSQITSSELNELLESEIIRDNICNKQLEQVFLKDINGIYDISKNRQILTPYAWIAAANIFEYNHRYVAAISLLENWIFERNDIENSNKQDVFVQNESIDNTIYDKKLSDVFEIRVRSMIGGYIYEWIHYQTMAKTQAVLDYYRVNLEKTIELLESIIKEVFFIGNHYKPSAFGVGYNDKYTTQGNLICGSDVNNEKWSQQVSTTKLNKDLSVRRMKLALVNSLLTMKQSWINAVLDGADYKSHKNVAAEYARELRGLNVSCMGIVGQSEEDPGGADYVRVLRAQNLDAYARVTLANANSHRDAALKRASLSDALSAAEEGLELALELSERDRGNRRSPTKREGISFMTSGTPAMEVAEQLQGIIRRINADLDRL